jgi:predicted nucleotidyltransferase
MDVVVPANYQQNIDKNLSPVAKIFFNNLEAVLDETIYFYGSVLRNDFNPQSDIDALIFTNHPYDVSLKLASHLRADRAKIKRVKWVIASSGTIIEGYKLKYKKKEDGINVEIAIYPAKNKDEVLREHYKKSRLPIHSQILLHILKFLFYDTAIISKDYYIKMKSFLITEMIGFKKDVFEIVAPNASTLRENPVL